MMRMAEDLRSPAAPIKAPSRSALIGRQVNCGGSRTDGGGGGGFLLGPKKLDHSDLVIKSKFDIVTIRSDCELVFVLCRRSQSKD